MRIGLDLDDTICGTDIVIRKYVDKYCKEKSLSVNELWDNENIKYDFLNNNLETIYNEAKLKKGVKTSICKLQKKGYKIFIVTARRNKYISIDMKQFINNYLIKNGIKVDDIFIDSKDKVSVCKENNIDIILEDNLYNYNLLVKNKVNAILFDELDIHNDIHNRITKWSDIFNFIK